MSDIENESEEFWLSTKDDVDNLVCKLSDNVLVETINQQIDYLLNTSDNDVLAVFNQRYNYISAAYADDQEIIDAVKHIRTVIYTDILNKFAEKYKFSTNINDYSTEENYYFYVKSIYNFFILDYKDNLINTMYNYIVNNKKNLIKIYKNNNCKNDLVFKALKKNLNDSDYSYIIYNIENIVKTYISLDDDSEDAVKDIVNVDEYEINKCIIKELFINNKYDTYLENDFKEIFYKPFLDEETSLELYSLLKYELMTYFKKELNIGGINEEK